MSWKKTESIMAGQFSRRGLDKAVAAGMLCKEAERLYPGLFRAISVRNKVLTVAIPEGKQISVKLIEGALVRDLNLYATARSLPHIERVRLTIEE